MRVSPISFSLVSVRRNPDLDRLSLMTKLTSAFGFIFLEKGADEDVHSSRNPGFGGRNYRPCRLPRHSQEIKWNQSVPLLALHWKYKSLTSFLG